jgi:cytoskeletal protein RodZ
MNKILGNLLKTTREASGLSLDDLATETKIQKRYLIDLEEENFEDMPGKVYEKGFLKTYAQALGLSEKDVLGLYEEIREVKPVDTQKEEVEEKHKISKLKIFIGIIFLIIISIAVVKTLELIDKKSKSTEKTIVVEEEKFEFTQEQKQENVSADITEIEEVKETKEEIQVTKMTKKVEIKLTGKVWLQVFINGKKEKEGEFTASEQLVFEGSETDQIFVKVGNIKNADVYFNGVAEDESTAYKNVWKKTF